jgi:hypothetical protein
MTNVFLNFGNLKNLILVGYIVLTNHQAIVKCILEHTKETEELSMKSFKKQVGGSHYKKYKIQPVEFIIKNNIGFVEGNIIKYVLRFKEKGGVQDLNKAKHYIELLIDSTKSR